MTEPESTTPLQSPGRSPAMELLTTRGWSRLHPLSPLVRAGRSLPGIVLVIFYGFSSQGQHERGGAFTAWLVGVPLAVGLVLGVVSWLVTRWRVQEGALLVEKGLLRRQSIRIPLVRVQAVDIVAPATARFLGLAEVRVVSAGRGTEKGRLAYLPAATANMVRAQLLALAHGLAEETPEPPSYPIGHIDNMSLVIGILLRGHVLFSILATMAALAAVAVAPRAAAFAEVVFGNLVVGVSLGMRQLNADFNFVIFESGDGLRLHRGLLQLRKETIPYGRIQAVRWVEPLLWRMFGWCMLEVDVARQAVGGRGREQEHQVGRTLIPIATREQATWLLARVMPGAGVDPPRGAAPPARARWKAPLSFHFLGAWHDHRYASARTGRVRPATVVIPLEKVQSARLASGPVQRKLRLATVHIDTAGRRWQASARCRDASGAALMLEEIAEQARHARHAPRSDPSSHHPTGAGLSSP